MNTFTASRSRSAITRDQMMRVAPSIFATEAHHSRSARFTPIPTIALVEGLEKEGFEVVEVAQSRARDADRVDFTKHIVKMRRTGITGPMNEALKKVNDFFRAPGVKLKAIEDAIKGKLAAYHEAQEKIRREEQRQADERAAAERRRAEAAAAEARRKAEEEAAELRRKAEEAAAAGRAAEAAKLAERATAKVEKAEVRAQGFEQQAATVVAPIIQREPPKVTGINYRDVWKFEVADEKAIPREFLMVDESKIRKLVQAMKGDTNIAGVRVWSEKQIAAGAA